MRLGAKQVVRMFNNETTITSKDGTSHLFCYDHCFWSFDDSQSHFADQETVYRELAQPLLEKAFEGYNTCLFAYGQVREREREEKERKREPFNIFHLISSRLALVKVIGECVRWCNVGNVVCL